MPYITAEQRAGLDPHIAALADTIVQQSAGEEQAFAGQLNYAGTTLALELIDRLYERPRYSVIALVMGVFHTMADEFYRRFAAPYEDEKIREHGDLYGHRE